MWFEISFSSFHVWLLLSHTCPQTLLICKLSSKLPGNIPVFPNRLFPHHSLYPFSLNLLKHFRGFSFALQQASKFSLLSVLPLSFTSLWPSSSSSFSSSWCVGCSQAWWRGGSVQYPQSSEQRRQQRHWSRRQHEELRDGRQHQPEEHHQRELSGAAGGRASVPVSSSLHPPTRRPRGGVHLLPRRVKAPDSTLWLSFYQVKWEEIFFSLILKPLLPKYALSSQVIGLF